jgi:hypothetical protein
MDLETDLKSSNSRNRKNYSSLQPGIKSPISDALREKDHALMETFLAMQHYTLTELSRLNLCRMHLHAEFLSEICMSPATGTCCAFPLEGTFRHCRFQIDHLFSALPDLSSHLPSQISHPIRSLHCPRCPWQPQLSRASTLPNCLARLLLPRMTFVIHHATIDSFSHCIETLDECWKRPLLEHLQCISEGHLLDASPTNADSMNCSPQAPSSTSHWPLTAAPETILAPLDGKLRLDTIFCGNARALLSVSDQDPLEPSPAGSSQHSCFSILTQSSIPTSHRTSAVTVNHCSNASEDLFSIAPKSTHLLMAQTQSASSPDLSSLASVAQSQRQPSQQMQQS